MSNLKTLLLRVHFTPQGHWHKNLRCEDFPIRSHYIKRLLIFGQLPFTVINKGKGLSLSNSKLSSSVPVRRTLWLRNDRDDWAKHCVQATLSKSPSGSQGVS